MGVIECDELDLFFIVQSDKSKSLIMKDKYFDEVPTLIQINREKWAESKFAFKVKVKGEWFLGDFFSDNNGHDVSLSFSKFVKENR